MPKRFRTLRLVAVCSKIAAWTVLLGALLLAALTIALGLVQSRAGAPSPVLAAIPVVSQVSGLLSGVFMAILALALALIIFALLYAVSECIHLGLAIEENTREAAYYLRGEGVLPPPPPLTPAPWHETSADS